MPVKFKIYYACSLYLLLWISSIVFLAVYYMITEPNNDTNIVYQCLGFFVVALIIAKAVISVAAVQRYIKNKQFSKTGRVLFIIGFGLICLAAIGLLLVSVFLIIPEEFMRPANEGYMPSSRDILIDISFFIATICATDVAIFDLVLLKAIRKKNDEHLLSFELDENNKV